MAFVMLRALPTDLILLLIVFEAPGMVFIAYLER